MKEEKMKQLNLGCGQEKLQGYINIDISAKCKPDYVWDVTKLPYPKQWATPGTIDRIEADNLCEHIEAYTFIKVINHWYDLLKDGGKLWIKVPLCRQDNMVATFTDPTHINFFTEGTFGYFLKGHVRHQRFGKDYGIKGWRVVDQEVKLPFLIVELTK